MPYKYIEETSSNEVLADEDVDIDAMETPMETKSTANWWVGGSEGRSDRGGWVPRYSQLV